MVVVGDRHGADKVIGNGVGEMAIAEGVVDALGGDWVGERLFVCWVRAIFGCNALAMESWR